MVSQQRDQRLEARVTADQKRLIERAALVQGRTVTDFVIGALQDAAREALAKDANWKLSQEQQKVFFETLANPPVPNQKLRSAYRRYKKYKTTAGR